MASPFATSWGPHWWTFPGVDIKVEKVDAENLSYHLSGNSNQVSDKVYDIVAREKVWNVVEATQPVDQRNSPELIDRLINSAQNISKSPIMMMS